MKTYWSGGLFFPSLGPKIDPSLFRRNVEMSFSPFGSFSTSSFAAFRQPTVDVVVVIVVILFNDVDVVVVIVIVVVAGENF